jgi:hypothetical protein
MRDVSLRIGISSVAVAALFAACTATNTATFPGGGNGGGTGAGNGTGTGGDTTIIIGTGGTSTGTSPGTPCNNPPDIDGDGDGWTGAEGDCNDCDPNVNPGAIDVLHDNDGGAPTWGDEDCNGTAGTPQTLCDTGLALDDVDAKNGARAIDLCQFTTQSPAAKKDKTWGVLSSRYVRANGSPLSPGLQVGLQPDFGPNVHVQKGQRMLAISSGHARTANQPGACGSLDCFSNSGGSPPPGFPQDNPSCPPSEEINDDVGLEVKLRAPTNATGYSFNFKFYSFEYPEWVCNSFNDQFIALVSPAPQGSINGNISFDSKHNPVSVNLGFFDVCDPNDIGNFASECFLNGGSCPSPPSPYCPSGTAQLQGTGFDVWDNAGATSWLKSQAPIKGGDVFTIRFVMWDTGDQSYDSTTLIDNFQWIANGGSVSVSTTPIQTPN